MKDGSGHLNFQPSERVLRVLLLLETLFAPLFELLENLTQLHPGNGAWGGDRDSVAYLDERPAVHSDVLFISAGLDNPNQTRV
jgi:hypothetical protein